MSKSETKVTRITASDTQDTTKQPVTKEAVAKNSTRKSQEPEKIRATRRNPFAAFWEYLKGSWSELRQVRWPDRRSTWSLTGALLLFTLFFVVIILLLDAGFEYLFKLLMGK